MNEDWTPNTEYFDAGMRIPVLVELYKNSGEWSPRKVKCAETIPVEQAYDNLTFTWSKECYTPADKSITLTITNHNKGVSWFIWTTCFWEEQIDGEWLTIKSGHQFYPCWWVGIYERHLEEEFTEEYEIPDSYTIGIDVQGYDDEGEFYHLGVNREYRLRFYVGNKEFTLPIPTMQIPSPNG